MSKLLRLSLLSAVSSSSMKTFCPSSDEWPRPFSWIIRDTWPRIWGVYHPSSPVGQSSTMDKDKWLKARLSTAVVRFRPSGFSTWRMRRTRWSFGNFLRDASKSHVIPLYIYHFWFFRRVYRVCKLRVKYGTTSEKGSEPRVKLCLVLTSHPCIMMWCEYKFSQCQPGTPV